jgi:hypothetical protein
VGLKIDAQTLDALTFRIAQGIDSIDDLFFGLHKMDFKWSEEIFSQLPEKLRENISKICGEGGLAEFLYGQSTMKLEQDDTFQRDEDNNLKNTKTFGNTLDAARSLVSELNNLPYSYRLSAPMPKSFSSQFFKYIDKFELGNGMFLMKGEHLSNDFPLTTGISEADARIFININEKQKQPPADGSIYFVQFKGGYVGLQKDSPIINDFYANFRQLLGSILAVGGFVSTPWNNSSNEHAIFIHRNDGEYKITKIEPFPIQLGIFYGEMGNELTSDLKSSSDRHPERLKRRLNLIRSSFQNTDHARRLSVSCIWYLRSYMSKDSLDGLLESTISLEALLGGANYEGTRLSSLLGNRCAYLVGRDISDRTEILERFQSIYALRSRIVHEGHHIFSKNERDLLMYSRELCRRSLLKEMALSSDL